MLIRAYPILFVTALCHLDRSNYIIFGPTLYNPVISTYSQDKHGKPQNKHLPTFTDVKQTNSRCRGSYTSYYTIIRCVITLHIMYLLSRRKSADGLLPRSRYALSRTRGVGRWAVWGINTNTDFFILNFCTSIIHTCTSSYLQSQVIRMYISSLVANESGER